MVIEIVVVIDGGHEALEQSDGCQAYLYDYGCVWHQCPRLQFTGQRLQTVSMVTSVTKSLRRIGIVDD